MAAKEEKVVPIRRQTKKPRGVKTNVLVMMTEQEVARLSRLSELTGISARSEIIRVAIVRMLREEERTAEKANV